MFAGAAREAVFSKPDVIKRVNADFVPVALKAALVNRPPDDEEGLLYGEIERSKPAPQGICVVNSTGKVLNWVLSFDDDTSLLAFFDHAKERYAKFPDAKKPLTAEVYGKFPSQKRKDVEDSGKVLPVLDRHPEGKHCPAEPPLRKGTVAVRLFGRALDKAGKPVADTVRQENYIEDRFNIAVPTQEKLAKVLADAGADRVTLPLEVTRQWVKQAYMGVLDVQPLDNPGRNLSNNGEMKKCDFGATKVGGPTLWHVEGDSEVFIDEKMANGGPGDMHEVKLKWYGFIEMNENRMTQLVLSAAGKEKLKFNSARGKIENEVALLPGGHRIDMDGEVRFGILGEPVSHDKVAPEAAGSPEKVATGFQIAEGPAWDGESLHFSDVPRSRILRLGSDGEANTVRSDTRWGAGLAFDSKRRLIICEVMGRRVTRVEKDGTEKILAESYEGKKLNGPNDLAVDAKDGIYFTDPLFMNKDKREQDKEAVYYIGPAGKLLRVADDLERPNGIALAGDGKMLLVADSAKSKLRAYPVKDDGTLGDGRDFGPVTGPDGVKVDLDGKVYAAARTGIAVWDASGKRLGTLKVPVPPTSLAFGDVDRRMMYITTPPSVYKIRIDQALKMLSTEDPPTAKEPPAAAPANPEAVAQRVQGKIRKLQEGIQKWQNEGKDPSSIGQIMQQFQPLMQDGKIEEAEAVLDKALALLGQKESQSGNKHDSPDNEAGFTTIFNGADLTGWDGDTRFWSVRDRAITGRTTETDRPTSNTFLIWRGGTVDDFELRLSYRIVNGNSGIQYRSKDRGHWVVSGYQA
ncbi:MAG: SMP-30/gluconolactonase/LRE family protein, partial [Verrucomicrobiales bacterium]|nr:SMP-30/gluconolactonase/LRE family protein [Verrucomicrobiales bacterium]